MPRLLVVLLAIASPAVADVTTPMPSPGPAIPGICAADEAFPGSDGLSLHRRGVKQFDLGHFDNAARCFRELYAVRDDATVLYNIGETYRRGNRPHLALYFFRAFAEKAPRLASNLPDLKAKIAELEKLENQPR